MDRRRFLQTTAAGAVGMTAPQMKIAAAEKPRVAGDSPPRKALMKLGTQFETSPSDDTLRVLAAFGVHNICSGVLRGDKGQDWSVDGLKKLRDRTESFGINLAMVPLPLSSSYITRAENPAIMLGKSPERDHEIDRICQMIRNVAQAGIPAVKYNLTVLGVVRTTPKRGRGGAQYSTFNYDEAAQEPALTEAGPVSADAMWERITYFLDRVVPVAAENKVRIACHPHDPAMPLDKGFRGVHRVLGSVDGLKRFITIHPSPFHGLNFCQGTVSEMLRNPGEEIYDVIRYFGVRQKIFNVHFRNIRGHFLNFQETFPDNGSVNMVRAMRMYKEVGYDGMMMPDHAPQIDGDAGKKQAFAFEYGYISALIQTVQNEA